MIEYVTILAAVIAVVTVLSPPAMLHRQEQSVTPAKTNAERALVATVLTLSLWALLSALESLLDNPAITLLLHHAAVPAVVASGPCALVTAAALARARWVQSGHAILAIAVLPAISVLLAWTNNEHELYWADVAISETHHGTITRTESGPWFWLQTAYSYACLLAAVGFLFARGARHWKTARAEAIALMAAIAVPWTFNAAYVFTDLAFDIDPTPSLFLISLTCVGWVVRRDADALLRRFALSTYYRAIEEPMFLLDGRGCIVDANDSASLLFRTADGSAHEKKFLDSWLHHGAPRYGEQLPDIVIEDPGTDRIRSFDVRCSEPLAETEHGELAFIVMRDITERAATERRLSVLANCDHLTGLANRRAFLESMDLALEGARANEHTLALLLVDVDNLKRTNDTWGHNAGDNLLRTVAEGLRKTTRSSDLVARLGGAEDYEPARLGGDEFAVVLPKVSTAEDAELVARRIREDVMRTDERGNATVSIGIATFPSDALDTDSLIRASDHALYSAKEAGGDGFRFFDAALARKAQRRGFIEEELELAMARNTLQVHFQPKVKLGSAAITGLEALLRWTHPRLGRIPPDEFIEVAERTGLISAVGYYVWERVCQHIASWKDLGIAVPRVAVNASTEELREEAYAAQLLRTLRAYDIAPTQIEVEITERSLLNEDIVLMTNLGDLRAVGVHIALDDFGTGYSTLACLSRIELDCIKMDRSLILDIELSRKAKGLVAGIASIAQSLELDLIAEGVETNAEEELLLDLGCDNGQGFLYSQAVPAEEVPGLLERGQLLDDKDALQELH